MENYQYNISPTLINAFTDVELGNECGIKFFEIYIKKAIKIPPTDAMLKGICFEYLITNFCWDKNNPPKPELTKKGEPTADYQRIIDLAELVKKTFVYYKIEIKKTGEILQIENKKGIPDIICNIEGNPAIIDLKLSSQVGNKWEKYGWYLPNLPTSPHILQAKFYKYLYYKINEIKNIPLYFVVGNLKNEKEILFIKVDCFNFEEIVDEIVKKCDYTQNEIDRMINEDLFTPTGDYLKCLECPLDECFYRLKFPNIKTITI